MKTTTTAGSGRNGAAAGGEGDGVVAGGEGDGATAGGEGDGVAAGGEGDERGGGWRATRWGGERSKPTSGPVRGATGSREDETALMNARRCAVGYSASLLCRRTSGYSLRLVKNQHISVP